MFLFFFFKQKTAYEMRISDWSSDVCSSDLHGGELQRRGEHKALPDRGDQRLAALPGLADIGQLPIARWDDAAPLAVEVDADLFAKTELPGHGRDVVDAHLAGNLVEIDVAGVLKAVMHVDPAVAVPLPAVEARAAEGHIAWAEHPVVGPDAGLQRRQRDHHLEGGAGSV